MARRLAFYLLRNIMLARVWCWFAILAMTAWPTLAQDKKTPDPKKLPRVLFTLPLGAPAGKTTRIILRGQHLDQATGIKIHDGKGTIKLLTKGKANVPDKNPELVGDTQIEIELSLAADPAGPTLSFTVVTPQGETKPHSFLIDTQPVIAEKESNDGFRTAQTISLPALIEGTIHRPKDVDVYRFEGKKGQKLFAEVVASRHGAPLDSILTLYDARLQEITSNDDFSKDHRDARIETLLPADGSYYLTVIDAHDSGSSLHLYRLIVK